MCEINTLTLFDDVLMTVDKYPPNPKRVQVRLPFHRDGNFELKFNLKKTNLGVAQLHLTSR